MGREGSLYGWECEGQCQFSVTLGFWFSQDRPFTTLVATGKAGVTRPLRQSTNSLARLPQVGTCVVTARGSTTALAWYWILVAPLVCSGGPMDACGNS